jgi:GTPase SAR1 family protein
MFEETAQMVEISVGNPKNLKLATPFGILTLSVTEIRESRLGQELKNIAVEEPVSTILNKSVSRILAINGLASGDKKHTEDGLKDMIKTEIARLDPKYRQMYRDLETSNNPLSQKKQIAKVSEKIIERITEKITVYQETELDKYKEHCAKKEAGFSGKMKQKGFWENIGMFFSWVFGRGEEIEDDYVMQLDAVLHEIRISGIIETDPEMEEILAELRKTWEIGKKMEMSAYLLERLLMSYEKKRDHMKTIEVHCNELWTSILIWFMGDIDNEKVKEFLNKKHTDGDAFLEEVDNLIYTSSKREYRQTNFHTSQYGKKGEYTAEVKQMLISEPVLSQMKTEIINFSLKNAWTSDHFPRRSDQVLSHLTPGSKKDIENKIEVFMNVHNIRQLYGKQCYIGFIGPQNAGKSTLLNALYEKKAETGMRTHTQEPTKYQLADDIFAIDFPGSDSLSDQMCASLESSGHMNNLQVYVIQYNGSPNQQLIENVKLAYRLKKASGKASKTLFCLNKASMYAESESFDERYRKEYVQKIKVHIINHPYDEKEESLWKKFKEGAREQLGDTVYLEIARMNEELKQYTLDQIRDDDFIFTDWKDAEKYKKGIKGPEEVRKRIRDFLVASNIRTVDNTMDI